MDKAHLSGDQLCDLAEGQLAPAARHEADAHVQGCADCRRELEILQGYFQDMSSLETIKAPDRFLTKVHNRIAKASPWKRILALLSSPRLMPVPVAAFSLLMLGAVLFYLSRKAGMESVHAVPAVAMAPSAGESPASGTSGEERIASYRAPKSSEAPTQVMKARKSAPPEPEAPARLALSSPGPAAEAASKKTLKQASSTVSNARGRARTGDSAAADKVKEQLAMATPAPAEKDASEGSAKEYREELEAGPAKNSGHAREVSRPVVASVDRGRTLMDAEVIESPSLARASAPGAPPSVTHKPWAPLAYTLNRAPGRADAAEFRSGLAALGVRVLRHEAGAVERFEIEVPAVKVALMEEYLRGYGTLAASAKALPGKKDGAPLHMTLRVTGAR